MQQSGNTLICRRIYLISNEPVLDFGALDLAEVEKLSPQCFTVELAPDTEGDITTNVDWIEVEPKSFRKGRTDIKVRLLSDRLQRGRQFEGNITVAITKPVNEVRDIPARVRILQYSDEDFVRLMEKQKRLEESLDSQRTLMEKQFTTINNRLGNLENDIQQVAERLDKLKRLQISHYTSNLYDDDAEKREAAVRALGELADGKSVPSLINMLEDEDDIVRRATVEALGNLGNKEAIEPLIEMLNDDYYGVREVAAEALGKIGDSKALEPLNNALRDETDKDVITAIRRALEKLRK
ncbi:HEAT repeat domain-containing protein [bacterium]|nr:HEAT repeat domain-containing protein [bacterium]